MSQHEAFRSHLSVLRRDLDIAVGNWMASEKYLPAKGERNGKVVNWVWALQLVSYFSFQIISRSAYFRSQNSSLLATSCLPHFRYGFTGVEQGQGKGSSMCGRFPGLWLTNCKGSYSKL